MPPRILIADDNAMVRTALRQLLEGIDHTEFIEAEDGQQAVSRALESRPEIVILDLAMPVMDGLTAARQINKALPETPIFLCTMHWSPLMETEAQKAGVRQVFSKAHVTVLVAAVEHLLQERTARLKSETDVAPAINSSSNAAPSQQAELLAAPADKSSAVTEPSGPQSTPRMRKSG
jgi:DNA-binding NarL/FixJ family response regulator